MKTRNRKNGNRRFIENILIIYSIMTSYIAIILAVSTIIFLYLLYLVFFSSTASYLLSKPVYFLDASGTEQLSRTVKSTVIPASAITNFTSSNYGISCWVYVNNWTDTTNKSGKTIYALMSSNNTTGNFNSSASFKSQSGTYPIFPWNDTSKNFLNLYCDSSQNDVCYMLCLDSKLPNLYFSIKAKPSSGSPQCYPMFITSNFPIQKWTNIIISMEGPTLDAYIDGNLIQSGPIAYLDNTGNTNLLHPENVNPSSLIIGNSTEKNVDIGVTRLTFYNKSIDPQTAKIIYNAGSGVSSNTSKFDVFLSKDKNIIKDINIA
jgi:hypothetical protein